MNIDNTISFERSSLARAVQEQLRELQVPGWSQWGLRGHCVPFPALATSQGCQDATLAPRLVAHGVAAAAGDIVQVHEELFCVACCASLDGRLCLVVSSVLRLRELAPKTWQCQLRPGLQLLDCSAFPLQQVACWTVEDDGELIILL